MERWVALPLSLVLGVVMHGGLQAAPVELTWEDLLPKQPASAEPSPPSGGPKVFEDETWLDDTDQLDGPLMQSPASGSVVEELDGKEVRLPGFIVPLDVDDGGKVTEFFLVPYFGACIHVPPPPPNQIVHVTMDKAFSLETMWEPFWIEGTMKTDGISTDLGTAGYAIEATSIEVYEYE